MFEKIKKLFTGTQDTPVKELPKKPPEQKKTSKPRTKKPPVQLSEKEIATSRGEPYISILSVDVDPNNINAGAFELDWNEKFILNLIRAGYKQRPDDTDQILVDRWFQTVCRNVALEVYEQQAADPTNRDMEEIRRIQTKDIGNGRSEIS